MFINDGIDLAILPPYIHGYDETIKVTSPTSPSSPSCSLSLKRSDSEHLYESLYFPSDTFITDSDPDYPEENHGVSQEVPISINEGVLNWKRDVEQKLKKVFESYETRLEQEIEETPEGEQ